MIDLKNIKFTFSGEQRTVNFKSISKQEYSATFVGVLKSFQLLYIFWKYLSRLQELLCKKTVGSLICLISACSVMMIQNAIGQQLLLLLKFQKKNEAHKSLIYYEQFSCEFP